MRRRNRLWQKFLLEVKIKVHHRGIGRGWFGVHLTFLGERAAGVSKSRGLVADFHRKIRGLRNEILENLGSGELKFWPKSRLKIHYFFLKS